MEPPAREGVVEGVPGAQSLDRYLAILSAPGVPPADRALAYAVLHQVQLRINRRLRPVRDELVEHMVRENMRSMGLVTLRSTSIDPAWPANEPDNWTDAMVQDALTALAADPTTSAYVRRIPAHLEIDQVRPGRRLHGGGPCGPCPVPRMPGPRMADRGRTAPHPGGETAGGSDPMTSSELATREPAPMGLFNTSDPAEVVRRAEAVARVLTNVLEDRNLVVRISGRGHVLVEGWTLLGSMVGVAPDVDWTRQVADGWEARALAMTPDGRQLGSAEAQCTRSESHWRGREDYALRSMAQTRAVSKALRMALGFVVQLAGYDATPAEEMPPESVGGGTVSEATPSRRPPTPRRRPAGCPPPPGFPAPPIAGPPVAPPPRAQSARASAKQLRGWIDEARKARGITDDALMGIAAEAGITADDPATVPQLRTVLAAVEALPLPPDTPLEEVPDHEFPY